MLLKRADERHVTMRAYENPAFVEDLTRKTTRALFAVPGVKRFALETSNEESIHTHDAYINSGMRPLRYTLLNGHSLNTPEAIGRLFGLLKPSSEVRKSKNHIFRISETIFHATRWSLAHTVFHCSQDPAKWQSRLPS